MLILESITAAIFTCHVLWAFDSLSLRISFVFIRLGWKYIYIYIYIYKFKSNSIFNDDFDENLMMKIFVDFAF